MYDLGVSKNGAWPQTDPDSNLDVEHHHDNDNPPECGGTYSIFRQANPKKCQF